MCERDDYFSKEKPPQRYTVRGDMEQMTGIEPAYSAWEADILPLNYICTVNIITQSDFFVNYMYLRFYSLYYCFFNAIKIK